MIHDWDISYEIAPWWLSLDLTDDKSTLVQVMAWCRQATSHYLNQCWPRPMLPCGVTRPQWVKAHVNRSVFRDVTVVLLHFIIDIRFQFYFSDFLTSQTKNFYLHALNNPHHECTTNIKGQCPSEKKVFFSFLTKKVHEKNHHWCLIHVTISLQISQLKYCDI